MNRNNIDKVLTMVNNQLKAWSNRGLSLLGKFLIFKTYGLSQILYVTSVITLDKKDEAKITELIYRFVWIRDMDKPKAPDRIKRQILNRPVRDLGFGMINFIDVIRSIRIKTVLRIINTENHPLKLIIQNNTTSSWINIQAVKNFRPP